MKNTQALAIKNLLFIIIIVAMSYTGIQAQNTNDLQSASFTIADNKQEAETMALQKNTIYTELGSNGSFYSINFDQIFMATDNFRLSGRIGLGLTNGIFSGDIDPIIPLETNLWWGGNNHYFETGLGITAAFGIEETSPSLSQERESGVRFNSPVSGKEYKSLYINTRLGYRYQKPEGGFFFRAGITPTLTAYALESGPQPRIEGSISIGFTFNKKPASIPVLMWN